MDLQVPEKITGKPRKLSRFMCQELLFDYISGSLDHARQEAMENYLPTCRDSMHELEKLRAGVDYSRTLANLTVPAVLLDSLVKYEPAWQKTLRRITLWSEERGWKLVAPLFLLATFVTAIFVWSPWEESRFNELARIEHSAPVSERDIAPQATAAVDSVTGSKTVPLEVGPANSEENPPAVAPAEPAPNLSAVYRATFQIEGLADKAEALRMKVLSLEGEMRPKGDKILDFSLAESKLGELKTYLSTLGPVQLKKDKRPQEMPVGRIRIILILKEVVPRPPEPPPVEPSPQETKEPAQDGSTSEGTAPTETP